MYDALVPLKDLQPKCMSIELKENLIPIIITITIVRGGFKGAQLVRLLLSQEGAAGGAATMS